MKSPKAVNRCHSRHVFSVNSARGKGEAAKRRMATKKKWQQSLLGLNPYATKAAIVFATFDLKVAEADRLNTLSAEQQAEKSHNSAQMSAEKDMQSKAKKELEAIKKQQKQERKKLADAARKEEEEKLAKLNVAAHPSKESENENSKTTSVPVSEEKVKVTSINGSAPEVPVGNHDKLSKGSSKKSKKNKKNVESDCDRVNEEVIVVKNIEPTKTPKNTPVDTPVETPNTPAEETHSRRKAKKRKSESSGGSPEHKTEKHNEEYDLDVERVPIVFEEDDKTRNNTNTVHPPTAEDTTAEQQHDPSTPSVSDQIYSVDEPHINVEQVVCEIGTNDASISEEFAAVEIQEQQRDPTTPSVADQIDLVVEVLVNTEKVVSETGTKCTSFSEEPVAVEEQQHNATTPSVSYHIDSVDKPHVIVEQVVSESDSKDAPMSEEPVAAEKLQRDPTTPSVIDQSDLVVEAPVNIEQVASETDTKGASISEEPVAVENIGVASHKTDDEFEFVEHEEVEIESPSSSQPQKEKSAVEIDTSVSEAPMVCSSFNKSKKNKKHKKKTHINSVPAAHASSIANVREEEVSAQVKEPEVVLVKHVESTTGAHVENGGATTESTVNGHATAEDVPEPEDTIIIKEVQQNDNRDSELEHSSQTPDNKKAMNFKDQDSVSEESAKNKNKKNRKDKKGLSVSHNGQTEISEEIIAEISTTKDELDKIVQDDNALTTTAPIQVNEVTSTETDSAGQKTYHDNISATVELDPATNPTQFALNVQKLVNSALSTSDLDPNDPNVKMNVKAQLVKITEREKKPTVVYEYKPITLAYERQRTVYERPSRERTYKLLNRDIIFCSNMIDAYGEDYESMAKDEKNVYRETGRSIQRKIRIFKESPHYSIYLEAKAQGKDVSELLTEECA